MEAVAALPFSPYAIPVAAVGFVVMLLGNAVAFYERGSLTGWLFFLMTFTVGVYLTLAGLSYAAPDQDLALVWARAAHVGVSCVPAAILWVTMSILGQVRRRIPILVTATGLSLVFVLLAAASNLFIRGNSLRFWGYYPVYGFAGYVFVLFFVSVMVAILILYAFEFRVTSNPVRRQRLTGMIIGFAVGYIGAVDFLPAFGVEIYAFGYGPILGFVFIMAFVVLRYRLVDITPAVAAGQILRTMESGVVVTDLGGTVRVANPAVAEMLNRSEDDLSGRSLSAMLNLPDHLHGNPDPLEPVKNYEMELGDSETGRALSVSASPLTDRRRNLLGRVFVAHDITDRKAAEAELRKLALYDTLTGLPNRVLFFDRLSLLLQLAKRNQFTLAILYMDLDRFKDVNDTLGHEAGDELLRQVADRMRSATRSSDTIARMGGDEFIGVCGRIAAASDAEIVASKLVEKLDAPFVLSGEPTRIGVSIGISIYPEHAEDSETLLANADRAMYAVKASGRGGYRIYQPEDADRSPE